MSTTPASSTTVRIYLFGLPKHRHSQEVRLLRREGHEADEIIVTEGVLDEARYTIMDGRRVDEHGIPEPWDFWRLDLDSLPPRDGTDDVAKRSS